MAYDDNALTQSAISWVTRGDLPIGVPIPRTGRKTKYTTADGSRRSAGVSGNSHILSHHYADELENGPAHRREIRRKERSAWLREWQDEIDSELSEMMAYESWE